MARSGCLYGPTGSFKTSQVKWFAQYIAETTGKATLLLSTDGGGWEPCQPEVTAGMIRPYRCDSATVPMAILQMLSKGFWPNRPDAPTPDELELAPINYDEVGGIAVEGWTSIGNVLMRYLPAAGINVGGEDRNKLGGFSQPVTVGGNTYKLDFRSNTRGDFGFVQNHLYGLVMNFNSLPVRYVLYTALEAKTEDDDRSTVYGPSIVGKKATAQCGAWVGDLIHAQDYAIARTLEAPDPADPKKTIKQERVDAVVRYYFTRHLDPATSIPFPAKPRVTPEKIRELEKRFPGGYFEPQAEGRDGFGDYLKELDRLSDVQAQSDALKDWRTRTRERLTGATQKMAGAVAATSSTK